MIFLFLQKYPKSQTDKIKALKEQLKEKAYNLQKANIEKAKKQKDTESINKYKEIVRKRIKTYCESTYEKILKDDMKMGKGLFNHRSHINAVQAIEDGLAKKVYSVVAIDRSSVVVHYINKDDKGLFVDNTLGFEYEKYDYYIVKKIKKSEFDTMDSNLMELKKMLLTLHSNGFLRWLFRIDEYNIGI